MRRLAAALGLLTALSWLPAHAVDLRLKFRGTGGGGGGQTSAWDAAGSATACPTACFTFTTTNVANDTATTTGAQNGTVISTVHFPSNTSGKWYWEFKILAIAATGTNSIQLGFANSNQNGYIGQAGNGLGMTPGGTFYASGYTTPTTQTGGTLPWPVGTIVGEYIDLATGYNVWTTDNVTFYGTGGSTTLTAAQVASETGGWVVTIDNRTRNPALGTYASGNKVQLLGGTNITRGGSMVAGYTVIP